MKQIPFLDLKELHEEYVEEFTAITKDMVANAAFIGGSTVADFEKEFAEYCNAKHCVGVANGTDALELALQALGVGAGDEVITAANTFYATVEAIANVGAIPVLADCDAETFLLDPEKAEAAVTDKTKAIIGVHLYGQAAEFSKLREIADRHDLSLVEDAAQAHGADENGQRIGTLGDVACFSFYPGKNLGACGDGGAVVTNDQAIADFVRCVGGHGQSQKYHHVKIGRNSRLDAIQAKFLSVKLKNLDRDNANRNQAAQWYAEGLADTGLQLPVLRDGASSAFHLFVVHVEDRVVFQDLLSKRGVATALHYPIACHLQAGSQFMGYKAGDFPNAEFNAACCVSLPMFPTMTKEQVDYVCEQVKEILPSELRHAS